MDLEELQRNWNEFGKQDPLWAILTADDRRGGKWDVTEFFHSGEADVIELIKRLDVLAIPARGVALDFGCGVGRLTQALGDHFDDVWGLDIAPSMIEAAESFNRHGPRLHYVVNDRPDLYRFEDDSFDLVYSVIVLQHMRPDLALGYVREFFRVCKPGGAVVFQMPSHRLIFPDGAYVAAITATVPARVQAGAVIEVPVQVRNDGDVTWPCRPDVLRLANHWLDEGGAIVVQDSGREPLPVEVRPGESVDLSLSVPAPTTPGRKVLELDLVHEGIAWFADRGSPTLRTTVEVVGGARPGWRNRFSRQQRDGRPTVAETPQPAKPVMEMYPVPREEVLALIANLGGTVAAVDHNDQAPPWESYTYYATKAATRSRNAL